MPGSFSALALRLGDLLSVPSVYAMPGFQRPYCWTTAEVGRLLEDLLFAINASDGQAPRQAVFFLGTVVLIKTGQGPTAARGGELRQQFDVIDGQQRLITLTILIAALRDLARADADGPLAERMDHLIAFHPDGGPGARDYRVTIRERDAAVLAAYAQQMDGCLADADPEEFEGAQRELILNRNFLFEELKALDTDSRQKLGAFLESHCQLVVISTDDTDNAFRIFTIVNQQGKPLSRNDLMKAELIGAVPAERRAAYVQRWEAAEQGCGTEFEQLFSHVRTAFGNGRAPIIPEIRRLAQSEGGGQAFLDRLLLPSAGVHAAMLGRVVGQPILNAPALRQVRYLDWLPHTDWIAPALLWIYRHQNASDEIFAFLSALDRYAYGHLLLGLGRDKRIVRYGALIDAIRSDAPSQDVFASMSLTADEQRNITYNAQNNLYARSSVACKLVLLRLGDIMERGLIQPAVGTANGMHVDPAGVSIEHVLPQRIARNSQWRAAFGDAERNALVGSLGNLVLVTPQTNKAVRNFDFDKKLEVYRQDEPMRRLALNRDVLEAPAFGPQTIRDREARLLPALQQLLGMTPVAGRR